MSHRVLLLTRKVPSRGLSGSSIRVCQHASVLRQFAEVGVCTISLPRDEEHENPDPPSGVAFFEHLSARPSFAQYVRLSTDLLSDRGAPCSDAYWNPDIALRLQHILRTFQPHTVVMSEIWLYRYLPVIRLFPCTVVLDVHDVSQPLYRSIEAAAPFSFWLSSRLLRQTSEAIEGAFIRAADDIWTCSENDRVSVQQMYGPASVHVVPNGLDPDWYRNCDKSLSPDKPVQMLLCGNFRYWPNAEAAHFLLRTVLPIVRETFPDAFVTLIGDHPTAFMRAEAARDNRVRVTGFCADVRSFFTGSAIVTVPLFHGSGTRFKILEAFATHCPVVSTAKGVEGLHVRDGEHVLLGNSAADIAAQVVSLHRDPAMRARLVAAGRSVFDAGYSWPSLSSVYSAALCPSSQKPATEAVPASLEGSVSPSIRLGLKRTEPLMS
jgi:glycosyltransferase involved in cell wall biosynthesis